MSEEIAVNDSFLDAFPTEYTNEFWNTLRKKASEKRVPIHGHFELTPRCNFNCKMCYVHLSGDQLTTSELSFEQWVEIIDGAIENGMIFASITGGECLLVPYFDELYLYLKSRGVLIFVLTNGFLLDRKAELFAKHPPAHIQVSVYGWDETTYRNVTERTAYTKVIENIKMIHDLGISISVAVTASKYLPSVYRIVKMFYDMDIGVTVSKWLIPPYDSTGRKL